jgi:hypothetical protein
VQDEHSAGALTLGLPDSGEAETLRASSPRLARAMELLAIGGLTFVLFPIAWVLRASLGLDEAELAVGFVFFHAAHFLNDPHFSVSYLLFYEGFGGRVTSAATDRAQRARWVIAGAVVPIVLVAWGAYALAARDAQAIGWMAQAMYLLVGWHYAKQGFGVLTVVSARRGITFLPRERTALLAHVYAAWALAWANPHVASGEFEEKGVVYWAPARPLWLEIGTGAVFALSTLALIVALAQRWRRERTLPWAELACFLVTIWIWTIATSLDPLVRYAIPALHSIQYLYFAWLVRRNEARANEGPPTFGPSPTARLTVLAVSAVVLGWLLFRGGPAALDALYVARSGGPDATGEMGPTPFFAVFYVVVNVHHYFMDFALWRRESPTARWLRWKDPVGPESR